MSLKIRTDTDLVSKRRRSICENVPDLTSTVKTVSEKISSLSSSVKPLFSSSSARREFLGKCKNKIGGFAKSVGDNVNSAAIAAKAGLCKRTKTENSQEVSASGQNAENIQEVTFHEIEISNIHSDRIKAAFDGNFLRRVSQEERRSLIEKLKAFQGESLSAEVLRAIKRGDLSHSFFSHSEWTLRSLNAYIQGDLDEMEISKLFVFDSCRELKDFKIHDARNLDDLTLLKMGVAKLQLSGEMATMLTKLDLPTRQFFSFRIPMQSREEFNRKRDNNQPIDLHNQGHHVGYEDHICPNEQNNEIQVIVYPPRLQYEMNKLKFAKHAVLPECVLGYNPEERMDNPNTRILCVPFRFVSLPELIHENILTEKLGMYNHDHNHGIYDSGNVHREILLDLAQKFQEGRLGGALKDRAPSMSYSFPHSAYASDPTEFAAFSKTFWNSLGYYVFTHSQASELIAYILGKEREWGPKYNISLASLEKCLPTLDIFTQEWIEKSLDKAKELLASAKT